MLQIKFSHKYPKLHGQESALLLAVELHERSDFTEKFIEYDTAFEGGHFPLPPEQYMVLVFLGNELIPFTTVRRWTEDKFQYYHSNIGKVFGVGYASTVSSAAPEFITQQSQGAIHPDTELLKHLISHLTVTESGDLNWPYSEMVDGIRDAGESSDVVDALVKRKSELYSKGNNRISPTKGKE